MARAVKGLEARISKAVGRAIADYDMIQDGDRVLVAVSGGKDSLTLLRMLSRRRKFAPIEYGLEALYVDLGYGTSPEIEEQLGDFCRKEDVAFHVKKNDVTKDLSRGKVNCFWCAWNRRKVLFSAAKEFRCRKLALGHHKDDIVETILMNLFFEGEISAMAPAQPLFKGALTLIRPLAYVEEADIECFVRAAGFKTTRCGCAHAGMTQRAFVKNLVFCAQEVAPGVKTNIVRSLQRIKKDYLL
jgi:tRNA 2-thiocytidine biosynthesis protein TtcA